MNDFLGLAKSASIFWVCLIGLVFFWGWSVNLSNFLGLGVEGGASPMYPQKVRVPPSPGMPRCQCQIASKKAQSLSCLACNFRNMLTPFKVVCDS